MPRSSFELKATLPSRSDFKPFGLFVRPAQDHVERPDIIGLVRGGVVGESIKVDEFLAQQLPRTDI